MSNWIKVRDEGFINADFAVAVKRNEKSYEMESFVLMSSGDWFYAEDPPEKLIEKILEGENK